MPDTPAALLLRAARALIATPDRWNAEVLEIFDRAIAIAEDAP